MAEETGKRSWNSVCGDCVHMIQKRCECTQRTATAMDSIAAVCEWFTGITSENKVGDARAATHAGHGE